MNGLDSTDNFPFSITLSDESKTLPLCPEKRGTQHIRILPQGNDRWMNIQGIIVLDIYTS